MTMQSLETLCGVGCSIGSPCGSPADILQTNTTHNYKIRIYIKHSNSAAGGTSSILYYWYLRDVCFIIGPGISGRTLQGVSCCHEIPTVAVAPFATGVCTTGSIKTVP
jgi:hypothetical protein